MIKKISDTKLIRWIDNIRFWINLITALLFMYLAYDLNRPISMGIGWLLLSGWLLGAYERRLLRIRRKRRRLLRMERRRCRETREKRLRVLEGICGSNETNRNEIIKGKL